MAVDKRLVQIKDDQLFHTRLFESEWNNLFVHHGRNLLEVFDDINSVKNMKSHVSIH